MKLYIGKLHGFYIRRLEEICKKQEQCIEAKVNYQAYLYNSKMSVVRQNMGACVNSVLDMSAVKSEKMYMALLMLDRVHDFGKYTQIASEYAMAHVDNVQASVEMYKAISTVRTEEAARVAGDTEKVQNIGKQTEHKVIHDSLKNDAINVLRETYQAHVDSAYKYVKCMQNITGSNLYVLLNIEREANKCLSAMQRGSLGCEMSKEVEKNCTAICRRC